MSNPKSTDNSASWRTVFEISTTTVLVFAALALVWANRSRIILEPSRPTLGVPSEPIAIAGSPTRGVPTAKVAIIEFTEFECPYCAKAARDILTEVDREFIQTGRVRLVHKNFPIAGHSFAPAAARAAICADAQGKYWEMHDVLFANQGSLGDQHLRAYAVGIGLNDLTAFEMCRQSEATSKLVDADASLGAALGVTGTPSFFFGRVQPDGRVKVSAVLMGAKPLDEFRAILNRLFAEVVP